MKMADFFLKVSLPLAKVFSIIFFHSIKGPLSFDQQLLLFTARSYYNHALAVCRFSNTATLGCLSHLSCSSKVARAKLAFIVENIGLLFVVVNAKKGRNSTKIESDWKIVFSV